MQQWCVSVLGYALEKKSGQEYKSVRNVFMMDKQGRSKWVRTMKQSLVYEHW